MDRTAPAGLRTRRGALLAASAIALVFAAAPERAAAQFAGNGEVRAGAATIEGSVVTVSQQRTVIDWTPSDASGPAVIDFLPAQNSVFYESFLTDYTVLNRILPSTTSMIGLNGAISSTVGDGIEGGQIPGGNVWFYTPYGFVIGGGATISVGGLVLTTNDISYGIDGENGATFTDANGAILFRGSAGSLAPVIIEPGAALTGNNPGSYIAIVAPRIEQRGSVSADRSIAYVAGEQVDLTINAGQFDIVVGHGTTDANGVVHAGITTGGQSVSSGDGKTISFVALPKNDALTMMLGGSIGYTQAASVFNDGSAIVLAAGGPSSPLGNIRIGQGEFRNRVDGHATGDLTVAPEAPGPNSEGTSETVFRSFADLAGEQSVHLIAAGDTRIQADRSLTLHAGNAAAAGSIAVEARAGGFQPGTIAVTGQLAAIADHGSDNRLATDIGSDAQGGSIAVGAHGGAINADSLYLSAQGDGGRGIVRGGNGTGGTIDLAAGFGGTITAGFTQLDVTGDGGPGGGFVDDAPVSGQGGVGRGGAITVADSLGDRTEDPDGGTLALGSAFLTASAVGGNPFDFGAGMGGDAFGGTIELTLDRQDQVFSSIYAYAGAQDGESALDPVGGAVTMTIGGGISVDLSELYVDASASAGINGPAGAFARGGTIDLSVIEGATLRTQFNLELVARADTAFFFSEGLPDSTADLTGGDVAVTADGGTIEAGFLYVDVGAYNYGAATRAGFAQGGTATLTAANGGTLGTRPQDNEGTPQFLVDADAYTGAGIAVGESRGGAITLAALSGGTIAAPFITIELDAAGETGVIQTGETNGAPAFGGTIAIDAIGGAITAPIDAYAFGEGGSADLAAGAGAGGAIDVRVLDGGALDGSLLASTYGQGGQSFVTGPGGDGTGGTFSLLTDSRASLPGFYLSVAGYGRGGAASAGRGGDGTGGSAQIDILGGDHNWSGAFVSVYAEGAASQGAGSLAGSARGSATPTRFRIGDGATLSMSFLTLDASAVAYAGGGANEAVGGTVGLLVDGGALLDTFGATVDASASMAFDEREATSLDNTPTARGGTASAVADGGTIRSTNLRVRANGQTAGALAAAGSALGGAATVGAANGGAIDIVQIVGEVIQFSEISESGSGLVIEAMGLGAEGPSAAHATGGTATLFAHGGAITAPGAVTVSADAAAGSFAGSFVFSGIDANGFDATGGTARVETAAGASGTGLIDVSTLVISAQGRADSFPVQGSGGAGAGGTAILEAGDGTVDAAFYLGVLASGHGGAASERPDGGPAYAGGNGVGGNATFLLSGATMIAPAIAIEAQGFGASGAGGSEGATPSIAGHGSGGSATFSASAGSLDNTGFEGDSQFSLVASGFGGEGGYNPGTGAGGEGGHGSGGTALFETPAGSTASLAMAPFVQVGADGFGGAGGGSAGGEFGPGGDGLGGSASMALADIAFDFGAVGISASGFGGPSGIVVTDGPSGPAPNAVGSGTGHGGSARFALVDSGPVTAERSIAQVHVAARGNDFTGETLNGDGGTTSFTAQVAGPDAALAIAGELLLDAGGLGAPAGFGFSGSISGAPVTVGGTATIRTPRDAILAIAAPSALAVTGNLTIDVGRTFAATGPISTLGDASVVAPGGIAMTDLSAGGTTLLRATGGPVIVGNNLLSGGLVTVAGRTVDLTSLGALRFADADATAGGLAIRTAGDLDLVTVDAAGAVTLTSTGGTIHATGAVNGTDLTFIAGADVVSDTALAANGDLAVDAGGSFVTPMGTASATGNVSLSANLGFDLARVESGGTTLLRADLGAVAVDSLTSPGAVTATGQSVAIASPGALTFTSAQATAGDLNIATAGDLALTNAGATGTTSLTSASGTVSATDLISGGAVTAVGTAVTIGSTGGLSFADARATDGDLSLGTVGDLDLAQAEASGAVTLAASSGAIAANGPVVAGGAVSVSGNAGATFGTLVSGGTTSLAAANGAVAVGALTSPGAVTASGHSVAIASPGALTFTSAQATAGDLSIATAGDLALANAGATGTTSLTSANGTVSATDLISGGAVTAVGTAVTIGSTAGLTFADARATDGDLSLGTVGDLDLAQAEASGAVTLAASSGAIAANGPVVAGGAVTVSGNAGAGFGTLVSGGTTSLAAANGAVAVGALTSPGAVTASGHSVAIASPGALTFTSAQATASDLSIATAGDLALTNAGATGTTSLTSASGTVSATDLISGGAVTAVGTAVTIGSTGGLSFADARATDGDLSLGTVGDLDLAQAEASGAVTLAASSGAIAANGPVVAGGAVTASGNAGAGFGTLVSGGTTSLAAANGAVTVGALTSPGAVTASGRSVAIASPRALSFADARATDGDLSLGSVGDLDLAQAEASGAITLAASSGAIAANGPVVAGGAVTVSGNAGATFGTLVSGGTTSLAAANGAVAVGALTSPGAVTASGRAVAIASPGALTLTSAQATAGDLVIQTAGNLALTGASASGALGLASTGGSVTAGGALSSGGSASVSGSTGVAFGALTSGGTTALTSANGAVAVTDLNSMGAVTAVGRSVMIASTGALTVSSAQASAGNLALTTAQGLTVGTATASGTLALGAGGALATTGAVTGAGVTLSGTSVSVGGSTNSSGALSLAAQQMLTIGALATGTAITATAGDITIGAAGRLGSRGHTRTVVLAATSTSAAINFGGTGTAGQFSLDAAEAARLFADERIALVSGSGNIAIGNLAMSFGAAPANIGSGGSLKVDTAGNVTVNGAVTLATSSAADTFSIDPLRIDVIAGSGSIAMVGASGNPVGTLVLEGGTVAVASQQTIDAIASAGDFAAIVALLDQPGPAGPAGGYLQAGTIDIAVGEALYIQNAGSGTGFDDRRGFAAETLSIRTAAEGSPRISINGVILGSAGTVTGLAVADRVTIDGQPATAFDGAPFPTINGCAINVDCARPDFPGQPSSDLQRPLTEGSTEEGSNQSGALVQMADNEPLITPPLVDEPITGVGNDDLWQVDCEPGGDKAQCPAGDGEDE